RRGRHWPVARERNPVSVGSSHRRNGECSLIVDDRAASTLRDRDVHPGGQRLRRIGCRQLHTAEARSLECEWLEKRRSDDPVLRQEIAGRTDISVYSKSHVIDAVLRSSVAIVV